MSKEQIDKLLEQLKEKLLALPGLEDLSIEYLAIELYDYRPDNKRYEDNYSYRNIDLSLGAGREIEVTDNSVLFECQMGSEDCTRRGYCDGDC